MVRALPAKVRVRGGAHGCRDPDPAFMIEHRVMHVGLAIPNRFIIPIGRWLRHRRVGRLRIGIANSQGYTGCLMLDRVEHGQVVGTGFKSPVNLTVGVDGRVPPVCRHQVVEISRFIGPVPLCDDDISLKSFRAGRLGRNFTVDNTIRPACKHSQSLFLTNPVNTTNHTASCLTGLNPAFPGFNSRFYMTKRIGDFAGGLIAQLMTGHTVA